MDDEILDVVDDRNEVIGQKRRDEIHAGGDLHRAVHILVFNGRDELLLQKRSWRKDTHPGKWDSSAAGHLNAGEGYVEAAYRELEEELGIGGNTPMEPLFQIPACAETGQEFIHVYRCRYDGRIVWPEAEIEHVEWCRQQEVGDWVEANPEGFASGFVLIWRYYTDGFGEAEGNDGSTRLT